MSSLCDIFKSITTDPQAGRIICVLDSLDGCRPDCTNDLTKLIEAFEMGAGSEADSVHPPLILISTRPSNLIRNALRRRPDVTQQFVLACALCIGYGATLVPTYFDYMFTYEGDNHALRGFLDAIEIFMSTGFAVTAIVAMMLNLTLPEELEDNEAVAPEEGEIVSSDDGGTAGKTMTSESDSEKKL